MSDQISNYYQQRNRRRRERQFSIHDWNEVSLPPQPEGYGVWMSHKPNEMLNGSDIPPNASYGDMVAYLCRGNNDVDFDAVGNLEWGCIEYAEIQFYSFPREHRIYRGEPENPEETEAIQEVMSESDIYGAF